MLYLQSVREQYEELPYPARNPDDESRRLIRTWLDSLPMINHYCFRGRQSFRSGFRVLVAGGGTGDGTIYLAEQLRDTNAEIVHVDLSEASISIARKRAEIRGLHNISWVHHSLLGLSQLGLGLFDYVNCIGVLHHLEDPDAGLKSLLSVLKPTGAMAVMLYGKIARTGVYQMQDLLRKINVGDLDKKLQIQRARDVILSAPESNFYKKSQGLFSSHGADDSELFDLLLHSQDRAYSVAELYDWLENDNRLHISFSDNGRGSSIYLPHLVAGWETFEYLHKAQALPLRKQQEIGELLTGSISRHNLYLTRTEGAEAPYGDPEYIPFFFNEPIDAKDFALIVETERQKSNPILINHKPSGAVARIDPGIYSKYILNNIDGKRSFGEIFNSIRKIDKFRKLALTDDELFLDFSQLFHFFRAIDRLLLRTGNAWIDPQALRIMSDRA